jgi:hypothetical protein
VVRSNDSGGEREVTWPAVFVLRRSGVPHEIDARHAWLPDDLRFSRLCSSDGLLLLGF